MLQLFAAAVFELASPLFSCWPSFQGSLFSIHFSLACTFYYFLTKLSDIMASLDAEPVAGHLSRLVSILQLPLTPPHLAELRVAVSAAISNYKVSPNKHVHHAKMLEAAAGAWVSDVFNLP